jgi:ribosomal protein S27E
MSNHKLDLLDNAMDSLAEALTKFEEGDNGNPKAYKFCVLHMAHFIELIFKHYITEKHPLLIYMNPFESNLKPEKARTIGLWEAVNFINNEEKDTVSGDFRKDLEWLKKLRNDIEHHKFEMDVATARTTIGRLFRAVLEFLHYNSDVDIEQAIPQNAMDTFKVLSDEYQFKLKDAIRAADAVEKENPQGPFDPDGPPARIDCDGCGNFTMVLSESSKTGYRCTFCDNEDGDNVPANCDICGVACETGDLDFWENEAGQREGRCCYCSGRYAADRDSD